MARTIDQVSRTKSHKLRRRKVNRKEVTPFQRKLSFYKAALEKLEPKAGVNVKLLTAVIKACGPSIYSSNSEIVATSKANELDTVKRNFLIKKMGLKDSPALDSAIHEVVDQFGTSHRRKYRAMFYYLLTKKLGIQEKIINSIDAENKEAFNPNLISFGKELIESQEDIDPQIMKILDEDFFELF